MDERYLVARVRSKGLVVLTGCSHAGVINVCQDVKRAFGGGNKKDDDIFFVVGGFHLAGGSMETRIQGKISFLLVCVVATLYGYLCPIHSNNNLAARTRSYTVQLILVLFITLTRMLDIETVKDMKEINPTYMAPGHCSGWRAKSALENAMTGQVVSLGVGSDFFITHQQN